MKRTYLNPECRLVLIEAFDVLTLSDNLFGQIMRFGDVEETELSEASEEEIIYE